MALITDALRQAFMPERQYNALPYEAKAWTKLQKPLLLLSLAVVSIAVVASTAISLVIVSSSSSEGYVPERPFCRSGERRLDPFLVDKLGEEERDGGGRGAFSLTDAEMADYYRIVMLFPSSVVFAVSLVYLIAGILVAYFAPARHGCLKVVDNNYCASRRGGVRCLSILNAVFAIVFSFLAVFPGWSLLYMENRCSKPLFWCYEISALGLVFIYGGTAFFLQRKAALVLDQKHCGTRTLGLEMLEAYPIEITPEVERRVNEGFRTWMGSSLLSSDDEEDEPQVHVDSLREETTTMRVR
ncbi:hypothetical protein MLD38_014649 [Melastoma candidum]|uniref:Uncharacterized protein n=1 Tax=Melastoma candidum TaxID=119954 RepID=A0ACB9RDF1_9MYRT|nr:hypothetical protein MLD38_014649 [Melastoma candidum]